MKRKWSSGGLEKKRTGVRFQRAWGKSSTGLEIVEIVSFQTKITKPMDKGVDSEGFNSCMDLLMVAP